MRRTVITGMIVGFSVPIFWGVLSFILFNAPESPAVDRYWQLVYITCPPWAIDTSRSSGLTLAIPFFNAVLYGAVAFVGALLVQLIRLFMNSE